MRLLPGLEEGEIASSGEAFLGGRMERPMVALEDQGILRFGGEHLPGHLRMTMQGVGRHRAALQAQTLEKSQGCLHLGTAGSAGIGYRQPRLAVPHAHHQRRHMRLPLLVSAAKSFAVDRHNSLRRWQAKRAAHCRHERCESPRQLRRIEQPEDTAESIVARHAMLEWNDLAQIRQPRFAELGDLHETLRPHSVAASTTNNISANTCWAFGSRGSRTSRKIDIIDIGPLPRIEGSYRFHQFTSRNTPVTQMRFPC